MKKIGILSYQGTVAEHRHSLERLGNIEVSEVKTLSALNKVDALILPGGESTTISKLLDIFELKNPLIQRIKDGMPVWGTCAGLILLAKEIEGESPHLGVMDITVRRNAYGRQIDSFSTEAVIPEVSKSPIPLEFIRAPLITSCSARVLCRTNGEITAARQGNMLATSFHPEFTEDLSFHKYFADMV